MSRPWKKQWPRIGTSGKKSYIVGYYDHERVERTKTRESASLAREWMRDYSAAAGRGPDSLRRFLLDLDAKEANRTVEFFLDGGLVKTHVRIEKGKQTDYSDYPPEKIAFLQRNPVWCRRRAAEIGPFATELVEILMEVNALYRLRSAQGVVRLADKYGEERTNAACRRALQVGDPSYKTVKGILVAGTEAEGTELVVVPDVPAHLHGPQDLFAHLSDSEAVG